MTSKNCQPAGDSEFSVLGYSPNNWVVDRIRDRLLPIVGGEWGEDPNLSDDGIEIPVIRVADFRGLEVNAEDLTIRRVKESKLQGRLVNKRTLLIEKSGGGEQRPVGRVVLGRSLSIDAICSNFIAKADCGAGLDPVFAAFLLDAAYNSGINNAHIQQTTGIQNLRVSHYLNSKFAFPSVLAQKCIASFLEVSCVAIDSAVAVKKRQIETLGNLRLDAVSLAVTRGLSHSSRLRGTGNAWIAKIPAHWDLISLKRVADIQGGLTLGKVYEGRLIERPYLRVANVQDGRLDLEDITVIEVPAEVAARVELQEGDVLMTEGGDLDKLGRGTIWNGEIPDCLHQNHIFAVRCFKHKLLPQFLAHLTTSRFGRDYFEATGKRTTNLASTNSTKVGLFPIPRPPINEQKAICAHLETRFAELDSIRKCIERQIDVLSAYRKSLIHECVTGQRRITNADVQRAQEGKTAP